MKIPRELMAGDSFTWDDDASSDNLGNAITSASWTLTYYLRGQGTLDLTASAQGTGWRTSITEAQSAALAPGVYFYQARAVNGTSKITLGSGQLRIKPNISAAGANFDGRSQAKKDLEAVQAAIRALSTGGVAEYTIANRSVRKVDLPDLIARESVLKTEVAREDKAEKIANGQGNPHALFVRFK